MNAAAPRFWIVLALLFCCYQAAEGVGARLLHSRYWQGMIMLAVLPLALTLGTLFYRAPLQSYALELKLSAARWLAGAFATALAAKLCAIAIGAAAGIYSLGFHRPPSASLLFSAIGSVLMFTFAPSIAEDILTRGIWFRKGPVRQGLAFVLLSTAVYVLNHIYRLANGPLEWAMLACFGLAYATILVRSGTLWAAAGLHWGWNAANGIIGLVADVNVLQRSKAALLASLAHLALLALYVAMTPARASSRGRAAAAR